MTDISTALLDPELGFLQFTVRRLIYRLSQGTTTVTHTDHPAEGCIHPGTPEMTQLIPEEERHKDLIAVYTSFPCPWAAIPAEPPGRLPTGFSMTIKSGSWPASATGRSSTIIRAWRY